MFQMRAGHMSAFQAAQAERFETRAMEHVRKLLPDETADMPDAELRRRVRSAIERARVYELVSERQALSFIDVTFLLEEWFDMRAQYRWARYILDDRQAAADDRASILLTRAERVAKGRKAAK